MVKELTKSEKVAMSITDIAKAVRKDLKKEFGKDIKFSVRSQRFAGGSSLTVQIKKCAVDYIKSEEEFDEEYMNFKLENPDVYKNLKLRYHRNDIIAVKDDIKERIDNIVNYYNFDESEPMYDYFCVNFYYHGVSGRNIEVI